MTAAKRANRAPTMVSRKSERNKRRERVNEVCRKINTNTSLDAIDKAVIVQILEHTLSGFDVRIELGVVPKRGAPPRNDGIHYAVTCDYLARCESGALEKIAASDVAERWGLSPSHVRAIAKKKEQQVTKLAKRIGWDAITAFPNSILRRGKAPKANGIIANPRI
jgi:hypothetical protein